MSSILYIILSAVLVNNLVFIKFQGIDSVAGIHSAGAAARRFSYCVGFVMLTSSALYWLAVQKLLVPYGLEYLEMMCLLLITGTIVQIMEWVLKAAEPLLLESFGVYFPLIAVNSAVLSVGSENLSRNYGFAYSMANAAASFLGFLLAMQLMTGIREKIERSDIPESFRGVPAALMSAAIISIVFVGTRGILTGVFGM